MNDWEKQNYISLAKAAEGTPYSQEYLSLLVRKGKLDAKKFGRNWYTTQAAVDEYAQRQQDWLLKKIQRASRAAPLHPHTQAKEEIFAEKLSIPPPPPAAPPSLAPPRVVSRSFAHLGRDAALLGITFAISFAAGVVGMNVADEWESGGGGRNRRTRGNAGAIAGF